MDSEPKTYRRSRTRTGPARLWFSLLYSLSGLRFALAETAFQLELGAYGVLLVVLYFLPVSVVFKCVLLFANTLVLIVELANTGLETIVDMISPEYDINAKKVKDIGSAAVFVSLVLAGVLWGSAVAGAF
jgi:diacylglycerol kinase (ATP)